MLVFQYVEHAGTEVLGLDCSLSGEQLEDLSHNGVMDGFERLHDSAQRGNVNIISEAFHTFLE